MPTPLKIPCHAFIDAEDIDYQPASGKLPVIVVKVHGGEFPTVEVVAPDGNRYCAPAGLLYNEPTVSPGEAGAHEAAYGEPHPGQPDDDEDEIERVRHYIRTETVWRVELNRPIGQLPRITFTETTADADDREVRAHFASNPFYQANGVQVLGVRRATETDAEEMLAQS